MDTHELLRKISALPIIAEGLAEDLLAGSFSSVFRGQGMEFDEARHYQAGDDVRAIDWNASARFGTPFVKMYREERELSILILLDTSASMRRGGGVFESGGLSPYEQGLLAAALIAFSAERAGQRVGAFFFDQETSRVFPPRRGRRHALALVSGAVQYQKEPLPPPGEKARGSNLKAALGGAGRLLTRRSMVAVISDFFCLNWERELCDLSRRHDVIALRISDPLEKELPRLGLVTMEDGETGTRIQAPTNFASFGGAWSQWRRDRAGLWENTCRRSGAAFLELPTSADAATALFRFFGGRKSGRQFREARL
jgi:uncharacterized protein (DUF58 family)